MRSLRISLGEAILAAEGIQSEQFRARLAGQNNETFEALIAELVGNQAVLTRANTSDGNSYKVDSFDATKIKKLGWAELPYIWAGIGTTIAAALLVLPTANAFLFPSGGVDCEVTVAADGGKTTKCDYEADSLTEGLEN